MNIKAEELFQEGYSANGNDFIRNRRKYPTDTKEKISFLYGAIYDKAMIEMLELCRARHSWAMAFNKKPYNKYLNFLVILDEWHLQLPEEISFKAGGLLFKWEGNPLHPTGLPDAEMWGNLLEDRANRLYIVLKDEYKFALAKQKEEKRIEIIKTKSQPKYIWRIRRYIAKAIPIILILVGFTEAGDLRHDDDWIHFHYAIRWAVFSVALVSLWENAQSVRSEAWKTFWGFFWGIAAIVFNPVFRFHFERETWQPLDLIILIGVTFSFRSPQY